MKVDKASVVIGSYRFYRCKHSFALFGVLVVNDSGDFPLFLGRKPGAER